MPHHHITIDDSIYHQLAAKAALLHVSVDDLVAPALHRIAVSDPRDAEPRETRQVFTKLNDEPPSTAGQATGQVPPSLPLTGEAWTRQFDELNRTVQSQAVHTQPTQPGYRAADGREEIYRDRDDAQL